MQFDEITSGQKRRRLLTQPLVIALIALGLQLPARAQTTLLSEEFDDVSTLEAAGWVQVNNSIQPDLPWFQGNDTVFPSHSGAPTAYIAANYNSTFSAEAEGATISNWLILPAMALRDGDTLSFFTRTVDGSFIADRLEVRLSTAGAGTDVGTTPSSVGTFSQLLLTVNPDLLTGPENYPDAFTEFTVNISGIGLPTTGRLAFRYFVTDGGGNGSNSNYIGLDSVTVTRAAAAPEPTSLYLLVLGFPLSCLAMRRRINNPHWTRVRRGSDIYGRAGFPVRRHLSGVAKLPVRRQSTLLRISPIVLGQGRLGFGSLTFK